MALSCPASCAMFQSHAGSIEASPTCWPALPCQPSFNPTLVRLRLASKGFAFTKSARFQSHAGSIEASVAGPRGTPPTLFQSHAGSIEASDLPEDLGNAED